MGDSMAKRISGAWTNQLGSRLELEGDESGRIIGTFESGVGGDTGRHPLSGYFDPSPGNDPAPVGLVVTWQPGHSVTVWSGHYHGDQDDITATWLLASAPRDRQEWHATTVGHDVFHRVAAHRSPAGVDLASDAEEVLVTGF